MKKFARRVPPQLLLVVLTVITLAIGFTPVTAWGEFIIREMENPPFSSNELFPAYENFHHPRIRELRRRYDLDKVVAGETDEFRRIMLLRNWIHSTIAIDDYDSTPTRMEAFAILDAARAGGKFNCAHFSIVQHAVLNSFGYPTRCLGTGPGIRQEGLDGHHAVNEVWVNSLSKWVLVDAKYDLHFEKEGIPLSALEIRDEVWDNEGIYIVPAFGLERKPAVPQINERDWGIWATPLTYRWCSWETSTNQFTSFPAAPSSTLIMFEDDIFRRYTWYRDGRPHWAYDTPYLITTTQRDWIYWTPNVISSTVKVQNGQAHIFLLSFTPNFKSFQIKTADEGWQDCEESLKLPLDKKLNQFTFRTMNLFEVTGPEHRIEIDWQAKERNSSKSDISGSHQS
ncbi:MAG: transglutaminase-like domain-containing protein [bacterium]